MIKLCLDPAALITDGAPAKIRARQTATSAPALATTTMTFSDPVAAAGEKAEDGRGPRRQGVKQAGLARVSLRLKREPLGTARR